MLTCVKLERCLFPLKRLLKVVQACKDRVYFDKPCSLFCYSRGCTGTGVEVEKLAANSTEYPHTRQRVSQTVNLAIGF